jgi:hypothetical protein
MMKDNVLKNSRNIVIDIETLECFINDMLIDMFGGEVDWYAVDEDFKIKIVVDNYSNHKSEDLPSEIADEW